MDFVIRLPHSTNRKGKTYDSIFIIVDRLTKIVNYKPVQVTIDVLTLVQVFIKTVLKYHGLQDSIVSDRGLISILKFWLSLWYFLRIKQRLPTAFYVQTDCQTKKQISTIKPYFWGFVNFE